MLLINYSFEQPLLGCPSIGFLQVLQHLCFLVAAVIAAALAALAAESMACCSSNSCSSAVK